MKLERRLETRDFIVVVSVESTSILGDSRLSDAKDRLELGIETMASTLASAVGRSSPAPEPQHQQ